jgi:hypothetical protein
MILHTFISFAVCAVSLSLSLPMTSAARGVFEGPISILQGYLWEEGGWDPPFVSGDELQIVGVVLEDDSIMELPWEMETYSYTFWAHSMIAAEETFEGSTRQVSYAGGEFGIYREPLPPNYDYGINPPNDTSPSTFSDGELFFGGNIESATIEFNATGQPKLLGLFGLHYTSGSVLDLVLAQCGECWGFMQAALLQNPKPIQEVPDGYDFGFAGTFMNLFTTSVETQSWGRLKALYR